MKGCMANLGQNDLNTNRVFIKNTYFIYKMPYKYRGALYLLMVTVLFFLP
jgi:hypothetical protein